MYVVRRRAGELQTRQQELEQLEQQRLAAERDTGRFAQALAQEKAKVQQLEEQLAAAKQRINEGNNQLHHLQSCVPSPADPSLVLHRLLYFIFHMKCMLFRYFCQSLV